MLFFILSYNRIHHGDQSQFKINDAYLLANNWFTKNGEDAKI